MSARKAEERGASIQGGSMLPHRTYLFALAVLPVLLASSVDSAEAAWMVGAKGGFNSAKFVGDPVTRFINRPGLQVSGRVDDWQEGFAAGVFARRQLSEYVGLQIELLFSQKGGEGAVIGTADVEYPGNVTRAAEINGTMNVQMDYVEVPVFAVFSFPTDASDKVDLTASAGAYVAYNTAAWAYIEGEGRVLLPSGSTQVVNFDQRWGMGSFVNRADVGGLLGAGLEWNLEKTTLLFDFRWEFGFLSIDGTDKNSSTRNNVISLTFGVGLPVGN
jgi:hypothetical protein